MGSCRREDVEYLKEFQKEGEGCGLRMGGYQRQTVPAGPCCVAEKEPGNEAQRFHDGGFNWPWRLVDLPWV